MGVGCVLVFFGRSRHFRVIYNRNFIIFVKKKITLWMLDVTKKTAKENFTISKKNVTSNCLNVFDLCG